MKFLTNSKRSDELAQDVFFYIKQMVNLHTEPLPKDIANYHKKHLFSLMSFQQKCLFVASFLFPYPEDAKFYHCRNFFIFYTFLYDLYYGFGERRQGSGHCHRRKQK